MKITFLPMNKIFETKKRMSLLEISHILGINLNADCGGAGKCGKCKIKIKGKTSKLSSCEKLLLSKEEKKDGIRLACQVEAIGDVIIKIEEKNSYNILKSVVKKNIPLKPNIIKVFVKMEKPSLLSQFSEWERLKMKLKEKIRNDDIKISLDVLKILPLIMRETDYHLTAVIAGNKMISLEKGDTRERNYGIAFDIGTTTVVGYLVNLNNGEIIGCSYSLNPQIVYGKDVISRLRFIIENENGLKILQEKIIDTVNKIIEDICLKSKIDKNNIYEMTFVGNTCMLHILLGLNPKNIGFSPYIPVNINSFEIIAKDLGINVNKEGNIFLLPCISSFVGADTVGMILSTEINKSEKIKLAIDLGTNGEIVLGSREKLICASCAAGPAFEGSHIKHGMISLSGAIERVNINKKIFIKTIGNIKPKGICGSGLVDAISEMVKCGIIDYSGRILKREEYNGKHKEKIFSSVQGSKFILVKKEDTFYNKSIFITQGDIRELQLAKSAVFAGIKILMKELNIDKKDLAEIFLAGAFGNYVNKESALNTGIIPDVSLSKVKSVGNAAGEGAIICLLNKYKRKEAEEIARNVRYVELGGRSDFQEEFIKGMFLKRMEVKNE